MHETSNHNTVTKKLQLLYEVNWENWVSFSDKNEKSEFENINEILNKKHEA